MTKSSREEIEKIPFYNKSLFWVIIGLLIIALFGGGNGRTNEAASKPIEDQSVEDENEDGKDDDLEEDLDEKAIDDQEADEDNWKDETENEEDSEEALEDIDREDEQVESTSEDNIDNDQIGDEDDDLNLDSDMDGSDFTHKLSEGRYKVGNDIPAGKYKITSEGDGSIVIYNRAGIPYMNEALGMKTNVSSITVDVEEGHYIDVKGMEFANLLITEATLGRPSLTTGIWTVGKDIEPGGYYIYCQEGNGNLYIYNKEGWPLVNEALGDNGERILAVDLREDYTIKISGINELEFSMR